MHGRMIAAAAALSLLVLPLLAPTAAHAGGGSADGEPRIATTKHFQRVGGRNARGVDKSHVQRYIDETMRTSGVVAADQLEVWTTNVDGRDVSAVIPVGSRLEAASRVSDDAGGTAISAFGVEFAEADEASGVIPPVAHLKGRGAPLREYCRTIWFDVKTLSTDDQVYDCYEKYKLSNTSYIYSRYSKGTLAKGPSSLRREFHEYTIRYREYKGYGRIISGPHNYGPLPNSTECGSGEFSYGGVKIPLTSCASIENLAGGAYHQTGTRYKGHATGQKYVDTYARYTTNGSEPYFSDYVWLTIGECGNLLIACYNTNNDYSRMWTDGGWAR